MGDEGDYLTAKIGLESLPKYIGPNVCLIGLLVLVLVYMRWGKIDLLSDSATVGGDIPSSPT